MNRTERLLELLQTLRGYRHPVTGERLAERMGVSIRTLYRDIATLQAQGAEIEGEAGIGYILKSSYFLPPLMLTQIEIQALILGTQWVSQYGDAPLSKAAKESLSKISAVIPSQLKLAMNAFTLRVGPPATEALKNEDLSSLRQVISNQSKIIISYQNEEFTVWPFTIGYFTSGRVLVAWCEDKNNYCHFETSKIHSLISLNERYPKSKDSLFRDWQGEQLNRYEA